MTKTNQTTQKIFDNCKKRIAEITKDFVKQVYFSKDDSSKQLYISFDDKLKDCVNAKATNHLKSLVVVSLDKDGCKEYDKNNAIMYSHLTKEEKASYLTMQRIKFDNDDYMLFDINNELFNYVQGLFKESFEKYVEEMSEIVASKLIASATWLEDRLMNCIKLACNKDDTIARVETELEELRNKREKLYKFFDTAKYKSLSKYQKYLLKKQHEIMVEYINILVLRLDHWFDSSKNTCVMCGKEIPEGRQVCPNCEVKE